MGDSVTEKDKRKIEKFAKKKEMFLGLLEKLQVVDMYPKDIMVKTIMFKLENGLKEEEYQKLANSIRGAMFGYIRHELVINYNEALKLLNSNPERDELYLLLKNKADKLIDEKYSNIRTNKKEALKLIKEYGAKS